MSDMAKRNSNRENGTMETNRFSTLLGEGASAFFLLLLAGILLAPEHVGHTLTLVLGLMNP